MQRLFSMFPAGRPGIALLLLRVALGALLLEGVAGVLANTGLHFVVLALWAAVIALCLGFLTPLTSLLSVVFEFAAWRLAGGHLETIHICAILIALALALLGPGGYSLDARIFGRRQVIFPTKNERKDP
jgi:hypothetical protein